jgi:hypothetical protein
MSKANDEAIHNHSSRQVSYTKDIEKRDEAFKSFLQNRFNILGVDAVSQSDVGKIRLTLQTMKTSKKRDEQTNSRV